LVCRKSSGLDTTFWELDTDCHNDNCEEQTDGSFDCTGIGENKKDGITFSENVQDALNVLEMNNILDSEDIEQNQEIMEPVLTSLSVEEAEEFMDLIRERDQVDSLISSLVNIRSDVVNKEALLEHLEDMYSSGRIDFMIETLTYVEYGSLGEGTYYAHPIVSIYDYANVNTEVIVHETCHGFNEEHGSGDLSGISGSNEGICIALANYYAEKEVNMAETVFGTVLYYRDIGLEGYPENIPIGDFSQYDEKGVLMLKSLKEQDRSRINWKNTAQVDYVYENYWEHLDRDQEWEDWLADANSATQQTVAYVESYDLWG